MTPTTGEARGNLRLMLSQLFEAGAIAARGRGTYVNAEGTAVPSTVRIVAFRNSPWYVIEHTAEHNGQLLASERVFALDGAIETVEARGQTPAVWESER